MSLIFTISTRVLYFSLRSAILYASVQKRNKRESGGGISQKFDDRKKASSSRASEIGGKENFFNAITLSSSIVDPPKKKKTGRAIFGFETLLPLAPPLNIMSFWIGKKAESLTEVDICSSVFNEDRKKR